MMTVSQTIAAAYVADDAFEAAIKAAGYKSRWDWRQLDDCRPMAAYLKKVSADEMMRTAFDKSRGGE